MSKKIARKVLCVMDAFWKRHYSLKKDSTLLLLSELQKRHFEIFLTSLEDLNKIKPTDFDFILMRKDPPVDQKYLKACRTLETFHKTTPVINNPSVIRQWSEKSMILNFPQWIPPTIITKSFRQASIFLKKYGEVVLKPLNSYASKGIRLISSSRDIKNIKTSVMLQAYLAHIKTKGEKRIFMVDGKAHGALLKIPSKKNFLANPDLGARLSSTTLSLREKKMCREIGQFLKKNGIFFAGLDVIDEHLTEINFTSPGLLWEWNELTKQRHEKKIVNLMIQYTKKLIFFITLTCSSLLMLSSLYSWDGDDHRTMTRHALQDVSSEWGLDQPVIITPLRSFLQKLQTLRPEFRDPWFFSNYLKINTKTDLETTNPQARGRNSLTPFEILSFYATDPDEGRDEDLFIRDEKGNPKPMFPDQIWFGELQGANSKAFRHLEKPPFSFKHPVSTFGFPFRKLGEATERAEIYYQLSLLAFSFDEPYWGWRFLAGSFHYLQDLHQPYHAAQITPALTEEAIKAYFAWGRQKDDSFRGFIRTAAHLVSNSHRFYESYTARPDSTSQELRQRILKALEGKTTLPSPPSSIQNLAIQIRDASNVLWPDLERSMHHIMNDQLKGPYDLVTETEPRDNPETFLIKGDDFDVVNQKIFSITEGRFLSAGNVMRTEVKMILDRNKQMDSRSFMTNLDRLLSYKPNQLAE